MSVRLDAIDLKILRELQIDGRLTNVELAGRVGISPPPCLRRVRALREAGFIKGYRALLDQRLLGCEAMLFVMVNLRTQAEADLLAFEHLMRSEPVVRQCWMLSGEIDFLLLCIAPSLGRAQSFINELTTAPQSRNGKTSLVLKTAKDVPLVPL